MFELNSEKAIKMILLFALINSSIFIAFIPSGGIRLAIAGLMNISVFLLIFYWYKLGYFVIELDLYFRVVFAAIVCWSLITLMRSFAFDAQVMISLFGHYQMGWAWFTPLAFVFGLNARNWVLLSSFFSSLLLVGSLLTPLSIVFGENFAFGVLEWMAFLAVMILTFPYQNKVSKVITMIALFSFFMLSIQASQRVNILFIFIIGLFVIIELIRNQNVIIVYKLMVVFTFCMLFFSVWLFQDTLQNTVQSNDEMMTDTRTFLFEEMFEDMDFSEELLGRGALGQYYSPYFEMIQRLGLYGDHEFRSVNEVGYLEIILKGGYIMVLLYLLILLPAAYLGIFRSNNVMTRMSGYFIVSYLVVWFVSYYPVYSAEYILLWMAAGTALSKSNRKLENKDILLWFKKGRIVG